MESCPLCQMRLRPWKVPQGWLLQPFSNNLSANRMCVETCLNSSWRAAWATFRPSCFRLLGPGNGLDCHSLLPSAFILLIICWSMKKAETTFRSIIKSYYQHLVTHTVVIPTAKAKFIGADNKKVYFLNNSRRIFMFCRSLRMDDFYLGSKLL